MRRWEGCGENERSTPRASGVKRNVQIKPICTRISSQARQRYSRGFVEIVGINFPPLFTVAGFAPRTGSSPLVRSLASPLRLLVAHYAPMQRENVRASMHRRHGRVGRQTSISSCAKSRQIFQIKFPEDGYSPVAGRRTYRGAYITISRYGERCMNKRLANK